MTEMKTTIKQQIFIHLCKKNSTHTHTIEKKYILYLHERTNIQPTGDWFTFYLHVLVGQVHKIGLVRLVLFWGE